MVSWYLVLACQILEYQPEPWDRWVNIGALEHGRSGHAAISVGPEHLPCFELGESYIREISTHCCA